MSTFDQQRDSSWFKKQKDTIIELIDSYSTSTEDVRFSASIYGDSVKVLKWFNSGGNSEEFKSYIENVRKPKGDGVVKGALKAAAEEMFSSNSGSIKTSRKVLLLFIDSGGQNYNATQELQKLRNKNVKIIVVLSGDPLSYAGINNIIGKDGKLIVIKDPKSDTTAKVADTVNKILKSGN